MNREPSKEYQNGYIRALLDVYRVFAQYERRLSSTRTLSRPGSITVRAIVDALISVRDYAMRHGVRGLTLVLLKDGKFKFKPKE